MNDMTPLPRHKQKPITIRSDKAAQLLERLTRDGRSQAQVIEEALAKAASEQPRMSAEEFNARIDAIIRPLQGLPKATWQEMRQEYYDDNGLPR